MIRNLKTFFNPKSTLTQFFFLLCVIAGLATVDLFVGANPAEKQVFVIHIFTTAITALALLYILRETLMLKGIQPANFLITTLIIYLLIHPTNPFYFLVIALGIAAVERIMKYKYRFMAIFNPAALAIFITFVIIYALNLLGFTQSSLIVSWWGADMQQGFLSNIAFLQIFVVSGLVIAFVRAITLYRKYVLTGTFFMTVMFIAYYVNLSQDYSSVRTIQFMSASLFNSFAFMMLVMIPEPKTSPPFIKQQALIGIFGGIMYYYFEGFSMPFISTILAMNAGTFALKKLNILKS